YCLTTPHILPTHSRLRAAFSMGPAHEHASVRPAHPEREPPRLLDEAPPGARLCAAKAQPDGAAGARHARCRLHPVPAGGHVLARHGGPEEMNRAAFFASVRASLFPQGLTLQQVSRIETLLDAIERAEWSLAYAAYGLA